MCVCCMCGPTLHPPSSSSSSYLIPSRNYNCLAAEKSDPVFTLHFALTYPLCSTAQKCSNISFVFGSPGGFVALKGICNGSPRFPRNSINVWFDYKFKRRKEIFTLVQEYFFSPKKSIPDLTFISIRRLASYLVS